MPSAILTPSRRLSHEKARAQSDEMLDTALDPELREALDAHLTRCAACHAYARTLQATVGAVSQLPKQPVPVDLRHRLHDLARG